MSRKDYEAIAAIIAGDIASKRDACNVDVEDVLRNVARSMADHFARDNARFDRQRFYAACGIGRTGFGS